jgi:IS5 family transposase
MRKKNQKQMPLMLGYSDYTQAKELEQISHIIDENPIICQLAFQDLCKGKNTGTKAGAEGMTADQVIRAAIVQKIYGLTYKGLAFHLVDSVCIRRFCLIGIADKGFKKSALNKNIKQLSPECWEKINLCLVGYAEKEKIEKGRKIRTDCTVVESNIHSPSDSTLLWDSVRVLARILQYAKTRLPRSGILFHDHTRVAKRRMLGIQNAKSKKERKSKYLDLIKYAKKTVSYSEKALSVLKQNASLETIALGFEIEGYIPLVQQVIDQTVRRIVLGQNVPASEKIVSIFEPHTDIIVKDRRETLYGHKVCLTGGESNLIIDCVITEGNPADTTLTETMLNRQKSIYKRVPLKVALDGGFASKENLKIAKAMKIKDVCFAKKRGLKVEDMCRSQWVYSQLRRFRAGIESGISWIKRCFGLDRCNWKGFQFFKSYVWSAIVSANLLTIARKQLA